MADTENAAGQLAAEIAVSFLRAFDGRRLDAECPRCGSPPAIRVSAREIAEKRKRPPDEVVQTVQCQECARRGDEVFFPITNAAYLGAA